MYSTRGIETIATITELRSKTSELVEHARTVNSGILIQKNNEPYAVLVAYEVYERLVREGGVEEAAARPRRRASVKGA